MNFDILYAGADYSREAVLRRRGARAQPSLSAPPVNSLPKAYVTAACVGTSAALSLLTYSRLVARTAPLWSNQLLLHRGQLWRAVSAQLYQGELGFNSLWALYQLASYMHELETAHYANSRKFLRRLLLLGAAIALLNFFVLQAPTVSTVFHTACSYIWSRVSAAEFSIALFRFRATYLPWIQLLLRLRSRGFALQVLLGILLGHLVYFFDFVTPKL